MAGFMEKAQRFVDQENQFTALLQQVEEKTGVKKVHQFCALIGVAVLWLAVGFGASLLCSVIGFVYPAYRSLKALETDDTSDDRHWLVYWVVYAFFTVAEFFSDFFLSWIPMFFLVKAAFLLWCMMPGPSNGALILYTNVIRPFFLRHEKDIDSLVEKSTDSAKQLSAEATDLAQGMREQATQLAVSEGLKQLTKKQEAE